MHKTLEMWTSSEGLSGKSQVVFLCSDTEITTLDGSSLTKSEASKHVSHEADMLKSSTYSS